MYLTLTCMEHLSYLGHLYVKEQRECDVQVECDNLRLWWANYLPFEPGKPSVPLTPGTPSVPSIPGSPRHVRWKDGESTTCILLECLEVKVA